jgi:hypothetical protein
LARSVLLLLAAAAAAAAAAAVVAAGRACSFVACCLPACRPACLRPARLPACLSSSSLACRRVCRRRLSSWPVSCSCVLCRRRVVVVWCVLVAVCRVLCVCGCLRVVVGCVVVVCLLLLLLLLLLFGWLAAAAAAAAAVVAGWLSCCCGWCRCCCLVGCCAAVLLLLCLPACRFGRARCCSPAAAACSPACQPSPSRWIPSGLQPACRLGTAGFLRVSGSRLRPCTPRRSCACADCLSTSACTGSLLQWFLRSHCVLEPCAQAAPPPPAAHLGQWGREKCRTLPLHINSAAVAHDEV